MKILGIDPGSVNCGYGLIRKITPSLRYSGAPSLQYLSSGRIAMQALKPLHERLKELYVSLIDVISEYNPDEIAIEKIFFAKGIKAALSLGHTRGVALLSAAVFGIPIHEYSALEVKKATVGYGRADKNQVQKMVKQILGVNRVLSADSADALAIAICHANMTNVGRPRNNNALRGA
ncbi:MAG: crossover junction endodeoxyribonuclease RuvC [Nitrospirae bacterium]|nr:crossover junction endodeoxyribonuclease RuvC [Nitrospirota bacterium]